ncbi:MAG: hypothetical protein ACRER2_10050 [Methylococcales bacterium]
MLFWTLQRIFACYSLLLYSAIFIWLDYDQALRLVSTPLPWVLIVLQIARHSALGMTLGFHRYYSHAAYKASRAYEFFITYSCAASNQAAMSWWAGTHRFHHVHCDDDQDPHSPVSHSFLYAWLGWGYDRKHAKQVIELRYPETRWLDRWCFLIPWIEWSLFLLFSESLAFATLAALIPAALSPIGTLFFNCISHGGKPDEKGCTARKYYQLSAILLGEHDHRDHHVYPNKAKRPGPDLPYWLVLWPMAKIGWIWDLKNDHTDPRRG